IQGYIIPRLQKRVNALAKRRVRNIRQLSDRIGETVGGIPEIHAHDTAQYHLADISERLAVNYDIRYEIYRRKFFIKFLNNFLNQLTPFFFYSIGGYLVIEGDLTFGALVAVLAAYKDLASPWKELLTYYQMQADVRIKYDQVVEQFQPAEIQPTEQLSDEPTLQGDLPHELRLSNVAYAEEDSPPDIHTLSIAVPTKGKVAILGDGSSGREVFVQLLGRILVPTSGKVMLGEFDYAELPESVTGRRLTFVGPHSYIFTGTLRDNLYYGLKHRESDKEIDHERRARVAEAKFTGNSAFDIHGDWIDYEAAGVSSADELERRALDVLEDVSLAADVYRFGLSGNLNTEHEPETAKRFLEARKQVGERLADPAMEGLVELWDADKYNLSATLAENLLFGTPVDDTFQLDTIAENDYVLSILDRVGLTQTFLDTGRRVASTMLELFADLPPGHEFFDQFSFISHDELPEFQSLVTRVEKQGFDALKPEDRTRLLTLPFKLIPSRHRLGVIDDEMQQKLMEARRLFAAELPESLSKSVAFFDAEEYNEAASLQDNILFGKIRYGQSGAQAKVQGLLSEIIGGLDLRRTVVGVGLDRSVGVAGGRLSLVQRQKLALARALLKRPDILILLDATTAFDGGTIQHVHDAVIKACEGRGLIWAPHRPSMAESFDEVIVLKEGRLAERGSYAELAEKDGEMRRLLENE
ncbi:MAG: ABC transporter ATP-binding protein, partial [Pseudomonadota bacterium]